MTVSVLVVEDEPRVARAHAEYVRRVPGFEVAGTVASEPEAVRHFARHGPVDLVLLDMHLADGHGLSLLQGLRAAGHLCDVIAVTAARDLAVVRRAAAHGVVLYLLKPFTFAMFRARLEQYADYRRRLGAAPDQVVQTEIDGLLDTLRTSAAASAPPKGLSRERLEACTAGLREAAGPVSATEVAELLETSRVTARRYLEHLADTGLAVRSLRAGGTGRPEVQYAWRAGRALAAPAGRVSPPR
ncbi:MAG: response regulator [Kineosporiaceae bacterium]